MSWGRLGSRDEEEEEEKKKEEMMMTGDLKIASLSYRETFSNVKGATLPWRKEHLESSSR